MKIFLVHNNFASYVRADFTILRTAHKVETLNFQRHPYRILQCTLKAIKTVWQSDLVLCWFGGLHALICFVIAWLFRKKRVLIASGYDVANLPEINYGNMRPGIRRLMGNLVFGLSERVLAVSNFTADELLRNTRIDPSKISVIRHGFEVPSQLLLGDRQQRVVTIGSILMPTLRLKGLLSFIECAKRMPDVEFVVIGGSPDGLVKTLQLRTPSNLIFAGYVPNAFESDLLRTAKVYAQLSRYESFGCGLAEAMLQGCIPVVTDCGALPEVVGDVGFIVPYGDIEKTVAAIRQALATSPACAHKAQQRIAHVFPLAKRQRLLLEVVEVL